MGRDSRNREKGVTRPSSGKFPATAAAVTAVVALAAFNLWSLSKIRNESAERARSEDARIAKLEARLDAMAKAQPAAQPNRGPDPNRVYTVRTESAPHRGALGAPVVIAEFSDFQ